ncbi:hypothetical protein NBRC3280_3040 [Acetobacter pasteurianus NBRC 3280]|uniref:Uncharacterized protein n=1 Tax=Acetobacter pasteurianus NBRC 3278 TaxID=1226660 RepID=A0A401X7S7_ACEPA|nr:hypothetical protein NBRC3277_2998 [Acetobacter pasteurianus NBRC 3277]GCD63972.1 hypothetical protein NBRC3278_3065 [Acetobacter pasteurianus NBRC 3278]GCD70405.1 hypothetical protein NBRC3280_3040 [Acetobacter pasteurianus NBRC 3280]
MVFIRHEARCGFDFRPGEVEVKGSLSALILNHVVYQTHRSVTPKIILCHSVFAFSSIFRVRPYALLNQQATREDIWN